MTCRSHTAVRHVLAAVVALAGLVLALVLANPASAAAPTWPVVQNGYQGSHVLTIQYLLRHHGQDVEADGEFGPLTQEAVETFQSANGLESDGIVGSRTWPKLVVELAEGDQGDAVNALRAQLNRHGADLELLGGFDAAVTEAVKTFQADHELADTGTADATTWQHLVGGSTGTGEYVLPLAHDVLPRDEYDDPHHDYAAIDLPVYEGTPAYATASGTAVVIDDELCGRGVNIEADDGAVYTYCHFSDWTVSDGQRVAPGDQIGLTGNTGHSTGPHLHFGIRIGDVRYCPQNFLLALYDGDQPPTPDSLPTSGCSY